MTPRKKHLGRGLDALLSKPAAKPAEVDVVGLPSNDGLTQIPVEHLQRGQYQPRVDIRQDSLQERHIDRGAGRCAADRCASGGFGQEQDTAL